MIEIIDERLSQVDERVRHGFFGRRGGVSTSLYQSLNCGVGSQDDQTLVKENRRRVARALLPSADCVLTLHQVHSADCHYIDAPFSDSQKPEGDALITDKPGLVFGVLTADCGPILFAGKKADGAPIIGAAHAGWSGALKGIGEATVQAMCDHGAVRETICATIGPCIGPKSYEVSNGFEKPFLAQDDANEHFFRSAPRAGHLMFDLPGYIAARLAKSGLRQIHITGADTFADEETYFSYRRATHRKEPDYGRQISAITLLPADKPS